MEELHPRILNALKKAKLLRNHAAILSLSGPELERQTQLSASDISILQETIAKDVPKQPHTTALQMQLGSCSKKLQRRKLSTGCEHFDAFLRGGVINRGITEIAGESASGKTQLCMQLCITAQLPEEQNGLNGGALYVCTEDVFPNKRLMQMVSNFQRKNIDSTKIRFTDNIFIEHAGDLDDLQFCITKKAPILVRQGRIKLIVIDSIAALFRCEYGARDLVKRAKQLSSFAAFLHKLSGEHGVAVICVNQVTDVMDKTSPRRVAPALGLSWANLVTMRLMLTRTQQTVNLDSNPGYQNPVRCAEVLFAPHLPSSKCLYVIDEEGVKALKPSDS